jgi:hypothetical protein
MLISMGLALSSGCSWIFMEKPPRRPTTTEPRCTATKGWAAWDGLILGADLLTVAWVASLDDESTDRGDGSRVSYTPLLLVALAEGVLHAASLGSGVTWANRCRGARQEYDAFLAGRSPQPRDTEPPPIAPPSVRTDGARFYCTSSPADSSVGACNRSREGCAASQQKLVDSGHDVGPCVAASAAVCFRATRISDQTTVIGCAPTIGSCRRARELASVNPDFSTVEGCVDH